MNPMTLSSMTQPTTRSMRTRSPYCFSNCAVRHQQRKRRTSDKGVECNRRRRKCNAPAAQQAQQQYSAHDTTGKRCSSSLSLLSHPARHTFALTRGGPSMGTCQHIHVQVPNFSSLSKLLMNIVPTLLLPSTLLRLNLVHLRQGQDPLAWVAVQKPLRPIPTQQTCTSAAVVLCPSCSGASMPFPTGVPLLNPPTWEAV